MNLLFSNSSQLNTTVPTEDWSSVYQAVRWIQTTMAILSILGSGSIIFYAVIQKLVRTSEIQPLFFLSLTDLLLALSWLIGALLFSNPCDSYICYNLHTVEQDHTASAIILAILMLIKPEEVDGSVGVTLYILQAFTSASQGLLNCLVYGWTQQHFRSVNRAAVRDADTQTPLLRSQKQNYNAHHSSSTHMQQV
ncbi:transmembrane protein 116 [Trichomycterus rosablanca]|uniref:transmembrane protein 116 n=1 Tax=Trichomycterus rosablanca TaxID=2290929 RepID=UPI002F358D4A